MTKRLVLTAVLIGVLGGVALAQTPWGGDDDGFIPPDKASASCENALAKAPAKAVVACAPSPTADVPILGAAKTPDLAAIIREELARALKP